MTLSRCTVLSFLLPSLPPQEGSLGPLCSQIPNLKWSRGPSPGPSLNSPLHLLHPAQPSSFSSPSGSGFLVGGVGLLLLTQDVFFLNLFSFPYSQGFAHKRPEETCSISLYLLLSHPFPEAMSTEEPGCRNGRRVGKGGNTVGKKYQSIFQSAMGRLVGH